MSEKEQKNELKGREILEAVKGGKGGKSVEERMEAGRVEILKVLEGVQGAEKLSDLIEKGKKKGHITITTDPDLVVTKGNVDLSKQKVTIKDEYGTKNLYFMTTKQWNKFYGKSGGGGDRGSVNPVDKAKDKAKDLFNKGKNLFKKKKKD